jgi:hypothetical protein
MNPEPSTAKACGTSEKATFLVMGCQFLTFEFFPKNWYDAARKGEKMTTPTISICEASHRLLQELADKTGYSPQQVLDKALDHFHRAIFFAELNAGYAALRNDPQAWIMELEERKSWDSTLMDGLDPTEHWTDEGSSLPCNGTFS